MGQKCVRASRSLSFVGFYLFLIVQLTIGCSPKLNVGDNISLSDKGAQGDQGDPGTEGEGSGGFGNEGSEINLSTWGLEGGAETGGPPSSWNQSGSGGRIHPYYSALNFDEWPNGGSGSQGDFEVSQLPRIDRVITTNSLNRILDECSRGGAAILIPDGTYFSGMDLSGMHDCHLVFQGDSGSTGTLSLAYNPNSRFPSEVYRMLITGGSHDRIRIGGRTPEVPARDISINAVYTEAIDANNTMRLTFINSTQVSTNGEGSPIFNSQDTLIANNNFYSDGGRDSWGIRLTKPLHLDAPVGSKANLFIIGNTILAGNHKMVRAADGDGIFIVRNVMMKGTGGNNDFVATVGVDIAPEMEINHMYVLENEMYSVHAGGTMASFGAHPHPTMRDRLWYAARNHFHVRDSGVINPDMLRTLEQNRCNGPDERCEYHPETSTFTYGLQSLPDNLWRRAAHFNRIPNYD